MEQAAHQSEQPDTLSLLVQFTAALAHEIRSPLSVIHNELSYVETLIGPDECTRAKRNCQRVAHTIASTLLPQPGYAELNTVAELRALLPEIAWLVSPLAEQCIIHVERNILRFTLQTLEQLLGTAEQPIAFEASDASSTLYITTLGLRSSLRDFRGASLSAYLKTNASSATAPLPVLVELLIQALGGTLSVGQHKNQPACRIQFGLTHA